FFQAEDGIRGLTVTGVQTCALPIWGGVPCPGQTRFLSQWCVVPDEGDDPDRRGHQQTDSGGPTRPSADPVGDRTARQNCRPYWKIGRASCRERGSIVLCVWPLSHKN